MTSLKGWLLIATPQLLAPIFSKSVILMIDHSDQGAMGLVLNRPTGVTVASVSEQVFGEESDWQKPILLGGPVPGPLVILHDDDDLADPETSLIPGVHVCTSAEMISALIKAQYEPTRVVANYAGWSPGQLEGEIGSGSWVTLPARASHVFSDDPDELWEAVTRESRSRKFAELFKLKGVPEDPSVN